MEDQGKKYIQEIIGSLAETWKGALLSAGISAGIFDALSREIAITVEELAQKLKYDPVKLEKWLYFMDSLGYLIKEPEGYKLTVKGNLLTSRSEIKDLTGMLQLTDFYMDAAVHSKDTFRKNGSLDKISDGKITRDYQPRVSDNFSIVLIEMLHKYNISTDDTLLDIGCGGGAFLRMVCSKIPEIKLTGMEANLFVIEKGKKLHHDLGIADRITLLVGNILEDLDSVESGSYDWVTAINVFHFIPTDKRAEMVENMIRISRKGVLTTEVMSESSTVGGAADVLMFLLWNDFTGFFRKEELETFNKKLEDKHKNYTFEMNDIMHGKSNLLAIIKK